MSFLSNEGKCIFQPVRRRTRWLCAALPWEPGPSHRTSGRQSEDAHHCQQSDLYPGGPVPCAPVLTDHDAHPLTEQREADTGEDDPTAAQHVPYSRSR